MGVAARLVRLGVITIAALVTITLFVPLFFGGHWRPDFTFMWAGARAPDPYDIWAVTKAQAFMFDPSKPLAFVYPPSSLPLFFPFGLLPFWPACAAWTAVSIAAFLFAARQVTNQPWLTLITPPVLFSIYLGQTGLMTGAAIIVAIVEMPKRPVLAGIMFGLAAALKPQAVLLAPLALLVDRNGKAIISAGLTWLLLALPAARMWPDWWRVIQLFPGFLDQYYPYISHNGATPLSFAKALGWPVPPFQIAGIALGVAVVVMSFRAADINTRIIGLGSGTLLASPYAMKYEVAVMVPAYIALLRDGNPRTALVALPMLVTNVLGFVPALVASCAALPRPSGRAKREKHD